MWAKAKHAVCYNGVWYETGEVFQINPEDREMMLQYCEVKAPKAVPAVANVENDKETDTVRRSNRRRARSED